MAYSYLMTASSSLASDEACVTACTNSNYDTVRYTTNGGDYVTIRYTSSIVTSTTTSYTSYINKELITSLNNVYAGSTYSSETYQYLSHVNPFGDPKEVKRDALRIKIRSGMKPAFSANCLPRPSSVEEERARKLLLSLVGEERYRSYLRRGFVIEQGKSGLKYKIKPGHSMVEVIHPKKDGKFFKFRSLCIQPKVAGLPPTDAAIMRLLLVRNDEFAMQKLSNVTVLATPSVEDERGVSDFLKERVA